MSYNIIIIIIDWVLFSMICLESVVFHTFESSMFSLCLALICLLLVYAHLVGGVDILPSMSHLV
jgi:hypothetical protein